MRRHAKAVGVIGLGIALMAAVSRPSYAGDGGLAAGIVGGTALGALAFGAAAGAYGPPPPPYGGEPLDAGLPPPCHDVTVENFDPYVGGYVETPRRVCDAY